MLDGQPLPAGLEVVIAAEMFRQTGKAASGRYVALPGAKSPILQMHDRPDALEPATEAVRRTNDWLLASIKSRFEALDNAKGAQ
jgi:hypothetical protein